VAISGSLSGIASSARLERVILRNPPLHVAEQDAAEMADYIANVPSGDEPDQRRRILI
jgi:hypothetical protein